MKSMELLTQVEQFKGLEKTWDNPFTSITEDDCPKGYEFHWARYQYDGINDMDNLIVHEQNGSKPFRCPDKFKPNIPKTLNGYILHEGLILAIREKIPEMELLKNNLKGISYENTRIAN